MASTKTFRSRVEAAGWLAQKPGIVLGQIKEKSGPPKRNWQEIQPDMLAIPADEPWLIKRVDGSLARVVFDAHSEADRAYGTKRHNDMLNALMESMERAARLFSGIADIQTKNAALMMTLHTQHDERTTSLDKSAAETTKALSVHKMIETIFARFITWNEARKGNLPTQDLVVLEKLLVGLAEKRAEATVSEICDSVGLSYETTKGQDDHGEETEKSGAIREERTGKGGARRKRS